MMHFHWQNLNEISSRYGIKKSPLRHGCCWLKFDKLTFRFSWNFFTHFFHAHIELGEEDTVTVSFATPLLAIWFSVEYWPLSKLWYELKWYNREIGFSVHDGSIFWRVFSDSMSWDCKTPKWRDGYFDIVKFFLGDYTVSHKVVDQKSVVAYFPEGEYPLDIEMQHWIWKRPRWPFKKQLLRANVTPYKPVYVPGKGENSWDCGPDAVHSSMFPASSIDEAMLYFVNSVLKTRIKYSGGVSVPDAENRALGN